jgi:GNAT superfamily N-acetyltransferase
MVIREATPEDADLVARLNAIVQDLHVSRRPDQFRPASPEEVAGWLRPLLASARVHVWVAECDGDPAGYVSAAFHDRPATPFTPARRWCEMDQIAVVPAWRRRGVARGLVGAVASLARQRRVEHIESVVWAFNEDAQRTLTRFGFTPKLARYEWTL